MKFFKDRIDEIVDIVRDHCKEVQKLYLKGSNAEENVDVDMWSDIDLVLILSDKYDIHGFKIATLVERLGRIIASEVYSEETIVCHRVFIDGEELGYSMDISVIKDDCIYEDVVDSASKLLLDRDIEVEEVISKGSINDFWFKLIVAVKKIMREDNLIGFHLLLDVIRDTVVLQMIDRDIKKGTNIHRYGEGEEIDIMKYIAIDSTKINKSDMLDILDKCARYYDDEVYRLSSSYEKRYSSIKKYIDDSRNEIDN